MTMGTAAARTTVRRVPIGRLRERILDLYAKRMRHRETLRTVRRVFRILIEDLGIQWVDELGDPDTIRRFDEAIPHENVNTRRGMLSALRTILTRGREMRLVASVPEFPAIVKVHRFPKGTRSTPPSPADVRQLMDSLRSRAADWKDHRLYALVAIVVLGGLGLEQALRLRVAAVDLARGIIWVPGSRMRTSNSPPRPVPITPELAAILGAWIPRTECEWLFPGAKRTGPWNKLGRNNPLVSLKAAARAAGVERITFESLRRYFAENAVWSPAGLGASDARPESATSPGRSVPVSIGGLEAIVSSDEQARILELLKREPGPLSLQEIGEKARVKSPRHVMPKLLEHPVCGPLIMEETGDSGRRSYRIVYTR